VREGVEEEMVAVAAGASIPSVPRFIIIDVIRLTNITMMASALRPVMVMGFAKRKMGTTRW
jgi:hypothetical protein